MAGGQERVLRRRIKSVNSTKKITRAMELIATTRIAKAQARVLAARPYAEQITSVIRSLAAGGAATGQPLLTAKAEVKTVAYVVLAADRGLAGAFNSSVIRMTERAIIADREAGRQSFLVTVGKKAEDYFRFRGYKVDAAFRGFTEQPTYEDARKVAAAVVGPFNDGAVDQVELVYTQFLSAGSQRPVMKRFMPIEMNPPGDTPGNPQGSGKSDYEYEPEPVSILNSLLPRYVESRLFAAMLESAASEHAARQRAMKSATENAGELVKKLSRQMNSVRQASITTEIMEIVSGAEALSSKDGKTDLLKDSVGSGDLFIRRGGSDDTSSAFASVAAAVSVPSIVAAVEGTSEAKPLF
jgi:F-type H+-transporting ATPase subunit gamma